ncbi:MAG: BlaI/MecI/CopY family transcriptional regulator [Lachnospiraceae bacterium]|nr:BlaI/MecI/CopY family transcriptional regulator [Lachnospiraceae bacterium]
MKNTDRNKESIRKTEENPPEIRLSESEYYLMDIIWEKQPIGSTELARCCLEKLGWKKSTAYTMLKRLTDKKAAKNENAVVTALIDREMVFRQESEALLEKSFRGSLPDFFAAFLQDRKLTREEAEKIAAMIKEAAK